MQHPRRRLLVAALLIVWAVSPSVAAPLKILAFGDSLTAGLGLPADQTFPAQLEKRLQENGVGARVINGGLSGDTTTGGLSRLDWALAEKPDLVIVELGANDMLRAIEPKTTRANLDAILTKIQASGAKVLLAGMRAAPNWGEEYRQEFEPIYAELAQAHGVALYPFFLDGVAMHSELNQPDGMHPSQRGVGVLVDRIAPEVVRLIGGQP